MQVGKFPGWGTLHSSMASAEFIYVADPMCSWCWGFSPVFDGIRAEFGDRMSYRLIMGGLRPGPMAQVLDDGMRSSLSHHWDAVAERSGQPFNSAGLDREGWLYDTEPPARAVVTVRELSPEHEIEFFQTMQHAFYADAVDIVDPDSYPDLLAGIGVDPSGFRMRFDSPEMKAATQADYRHARELGIGGFPSVVVRKGDELALLTRGWAPLDRLVPALAGWLDT